MSIKEETYEERTEREARELRARRIEHRRKLRQVCKALGERFELEAESEGNQDYAYLVSRRDPEARIVVWLPTRYRSGGKFHFSCERIKSKHPNFSHYGYYNSRTDPKIGVSASRTAASIARDLSRRFLPDFWKSRKEHKGARDKYDQRHEDKLATATRIASVWDPGREVDREGRVYIGSKEIPCVDRVYVEEHPRDEVPGRHVHFELGGLTAEESLALGNFLRSLRGLAPLTEHRPERPRNSLWR